MNQSNILSIAESRPQAQGALAKAESDKRTSEIQAKLVIAKRFPRDQTVSYHNIMEACKRPSLAEVSIYSYPRGGTAVTGPSIRMAEMLAQNWGNMEFGIREVERNNGESTMEAFAWDLETNVCKTVQFQVEHARTVKKQGGGHIKKTLDDPRDVYEMVANQGARRLRSCILNVIPGDITESALEACKKTLTGANREPLQDRLRKMVSAFSEQGVTLDMITEHLGHELDRVTESQFVTLRGIYSALKDGQAKREDFFNVNAGSKSDDQSNDDDGDLAPTPKAKRKTEPSNDAAKVVEALGEHEEAGWRYAVGQGWITEEQSLQDLKPVHAKAILANIPALLKTLTKGKA